MGRRNKISLQTRIISGYLVLMAVISGMTAILLYEHERINNIEAEYGKIRSMRSDINTVHQHITILAILGENVMSWEGMDYREYSCVRLLTDSLLQTLKPHCREYVQSSQIDTLRHLLAEKETHLLHIMQNIAHRKERENMLVNQLPEVARRATRVRTIEKKKKGIAGFFGGKKEVWIMPSTKELYAFSDSLITMQQRQAQEMDTYADSLRVRNRTLNRTLNKLVSDLDKQAYLSFSKREQKIEDTRNESFRLLAITLSFAVILLCLSYLTIHREIKRNVRAKIKREELIGKLQETIRQNEELTKEKQNIMQTITHELRSPLFAIRGYASLMEKEHDPEKSAKYMRSILQSSDRMRGMLNTLLDFFRLDCGKEQPNLSPCRISSFTQTLKTEFTPAAMNKGLALVVENRSDAFVITDKERILQIGNNLLSNAVKFTENGHVSLLTEYRDGKLVLTVEDTGTGMTDEEQQRVFGAFERLSNAATQDGFGLGLSIVRHIVKMLGGNIRLESEKGKGSRFIAEIPAQIIAETPMPDVESRARYAPMYRDVIAIDNDEVSLQMMKEMYIHEGVRCDICTNVAELVEMVRRKDYSLLLTDLNMPEINGFELLELLRSSNVGNSRTIPVVVTTGSGSCDAEELLAHGFSGSLFKPFSISELMEVTDLYAMKGERSGRPNFSSLLSYGNEASMLDKLTMETEKEMQALREAKCRNDLKGLNALTHHLRSSWEILRVDQPLKVLYRLLHGEGTPDNEALSHAVDGVLEKGAEIIRLAKEERRKYGQG